jgi:hypothetical protein
MPPSILPSPSDFSAGPAKWVADWHFGHLLTYRLLAFLPSARQRMLDDEAQRRGAKTLRPTRTSENVLAGGPDLPWRGAFIPRPGMFHRNHRRGPLAFSKSLNLR